MQFVLIAHDDTDDHAAERRMAARDAHLKLARQLYDAGRWLYAAAIQNDDGRAIGSLIVCDFPSREEIQTQWLAGEPYVTGKVWKRIEIHRAQVAPFCQKG